jgi:hypothetical protein
MKQKPTGTGLMIAAFCIATAVAAAALSVFGTETSGLGRALEATARFSFLLFWLAYAGGALRTLFGSAFEAIASRQRDFGLAFACAYSVHVGLVVWLYHISDQPPWQGPVFWLFLAGQIWPYCLALLSIRRLAQALGQVRWRMIRLVGMEYISFSFLLNFVNNPAPGNIWNLVTYAPFIALTVTGTFLRVAAWASRGATLAKNA